MAALKRLLPKNTDRTPEKTSEFTYVFRCSCGAEIKRDLWPGMINENRRARSDLKDFSAKHSEFFNRGHATKVIQEGRIPL